ncbi:uncharacterized protein MONBRDRAFT_31356, partial [Monosiga brevicollis MX1]
MRHAFPLLFSFDAFLFFLDTAMATLDLSKDAPTALLILGQHLGSKITVNKGAKSTAFNADGASFSKVPTVIKCLGRLVEPKLGGTTPAEQTQVDHWVDVGIKIAGTKQGDLTAQFKELDAHLARRTFFLGNEHEPSLADAAIFGGLTDCALFHRAAGELGLKHLNRWIQTCSTQAAFQTAYTQLQKALAGGNKGNASKGRAEGKGKGAAKDTPRVKQADQGKFVDLEGAEDGKVVTRFPPEASGYLHIGHAKAALLNEYFARKYNGTLLMRFDDTNPAKENAEFEKVILEDLELLGVRYDKFSHTSDHFDYLIEQIEKMIKLGKAYVDNSPKEVMAEQRMNKQKSPCRDHSVEKNLAMWEEMKAGTELGQQCIVRAKIRYDDNNGAMRDPTMYRCKPESHIRTGTKYKVYPTYDFACPIVDSIEGVTHALRTTEYHERDPQYYWVCDALGLRKPKIWDFSRLNMVKTVMSKRQLTEFVKQGIADGWSDPRFPTVRGILRHGMTLEGLRNFILMQGASKTAVQMEWDKIWAVNKKVIDPVAPRFTALEQKDLVTVSVVNQKKVDAIEVPLHPKKPEFGSRKVVVGPKIFLEQADCRLMQEGEKVTLMNWGNAIVEKIEKDGETVTALSLRVTPEDTDYKKTAKYTFLAAGEAEELVTIKAMEYTYFIDCNFVPKGEDVTTHLVDKSEFEIDLVGTAQLAELQPGHIIQLNRKGFFICDKPYHKLLEKPLTLIYIPDGHEKTFIAHREGEDITTVSADEYKALEDQITSQHNVVTDMKKTKADKKDIKAAEARLKELRAQLEGMAVKGGKTASSAVPAAAAGAVDTAEIEKEIQVQGDKIRDLKASKASKDELKPFIDRLLSLKAEFKQATGRDFAPAAAGGSKKEAKKEGKKETKKEAKKEAAPAASTPVQTSAASPEAAALLEAVAAQGNQVRELKSSKADKALVDEAVKQLLALKAEYKTLTGEAVPSGGNARDSKKESKPAEAKKEAKKDKKEAKKDKKEAKTKPVQEKGKTRLGVEAPKATDLSAWYSEVIIKSELIDYYDVSGCYILRPWAYSVWQSIQEFFDREIRARGVQNSYFPIFVSQAALEREKEHIADFAPEVAWVTRSGESELEKPIAVRPTSETVMYPAYAKWIQSHRDLPLKLNQWCNVVRWEFKQPTPFLRTREFLWQEGHTAFATKPEADEEVLEILELYRRVYEELLAVPVVPGRKTEKEKFAGGDYTTTVEAYIGANGRAIQGATSHHLGQNFSKMFGIKYQNPDKHDEFINVFQNSWGITTRTIGVMIMVHGDDKGLVLPPRVASIQAIIIPTG